jgi:Ribbon-helix-helix protein, copG family
VTARSQVVAHGCAEFLRARLWPGSNRPVTVDNTSVAVAWLGSTDKHGIHRSETLYAMTNDQTNPTKAKVDALVQWAEAGEFDPRSTGAQALHGAAAAAAGRALLGAAGVDVEAVGGRPRLDPDTRRGARSPRINVAIPETMDDVLSALAKARGVRTSVLVREALARYLDAN